MKTKIIKMDMIDFTLAVIVGGTKEQRRKWVFDNFPKAPKDWVMQATILKRVVSSADGNEMFEAGAQVCHEVEGSPSLVVMEKHHDKVWIFAHEAHHVLSYLHDVRGMCITGDGQEWGSMIMEYLVKQYCDKKTWVFVE
jgi:hypothetical protein